MSLDAIGIVSSDLERTKSFYSLLNIELKEAGSPDHLEAKTKSGVRIMIDSIELMKKINPDFVKGSGTSIVLAFLQDSPKEVDALTEKIKADNFEIVKEPWDAFWGQRYASVKDPDGNQIDLFAAL